MAFVTGLPLCRSLARGLLSSTSAPRLAVRHAAAGARTRMAYTPPEPRSGTESGFDADKLVEKANELGADLAARPAYYVKIAGYGLGALVALSIVRSVVGAIDAIPVLPSALELVGLGYTSWFVWRYVIFKESREELMAEIEDFVGRARPKSE